MTHRFLAQQNFQKVISYPDEEIDLARAALCIAQYEYPDLQVSPYLDRLDQLAATIYDRLPPERYPLRILQVINQHLYQEEGFRGNTKHYYDPRNSFLNEVLDRRLGIPISLALVYMEVAKRLTFPMEGIGMPGHFLIRPQVDEMDIYVDAFHRGDILFPQDCQERLSQIHGQPVTLKPSYLAPLSNSQFLARMLNNLKAIYINQNDLAKALGTIDCILLLFPHWWHERRNRGLILYELEDWDAAYEDLSAYLQANPQAPDAEVLRQLLGKPRPPS